MATKAKPKVKKVLWGGEMIPCTDPRILETYGNKEYRLEHFYRIINKEGRSVAMVMRPAQRKFHDSKHRRNIILKSRQLGFTTLACIDMLDDSLWTNNFTAVIIAHQKDALEDIFRKVLFGWEFFYENFGRGLGFNADTSRSNMLRFNNGSSIKVALSSRSSTVNRLHVSEFGKICAKYPYKAEEIITGAIPSVPKGGRIDIESTAEGEIGYFAEMFWDAWDRGEPSNELEFKSFFFPWTDDPDYEMAVDKGMVPQKLLEYQKEHNLTDGQLGWYFFTQRTQGDKMKREYPTTPEEAFESSGVKVFDIDILNERIKRDVEEDPEISGSWRWYGEWVPTHLYVMGADPSEGIGRDSCVAHVIDLSYRDPQGNLRPKVVAVYHSKTTPPDLFAYELKRGGERYGNCLIGVERNGNGLATIMELKKIYFNLYHEMRRTSLVDKQTQRLGFLTTSGTKPAIIYNLKTTVNEDELIIPDKATLREMKMFDEDQLKTVKFDETLSRHLDRVMSLAIAWEMRSSVGGVGSMGEIEGDYASEFDPYASFDF